MLYNIFYNKAKMLYMLQSIISSDLATAVSWFGDLSSVIVDYAKLLPDSIYKIRSDTWLYIRNNEWKLSEK